MTSRSEKCIHGRMHEAASVFFRATRRGCFAGCVFFVFCLDSPSRANPVTLDLRAALSNNVLLTNIVVTTSITNNPVISWLDVAIAARSADAVAGFKNVNNFGIGVAGGTSDLWLDAGGTNGGEQLTFHFVARDSQSNAVATPVSVHGLTFRRAAGPNFRILFSGGSETATMTGAGSSGLTVKQNLLCPYLLNSTNVLTLTRAGTDAAFQLAGMEISFSSSNSAMLGVVVTSDPTVSTHTVTAGVMRLGISASGGGFVNQVNIGGGPDLMRTEAAYGRGWQGSVRDTLHSGRYNPTQAGFRDYAGARALLSYASNRLTILRYQVPLYSDPVFDFTVHEELASDYEGYNDGLNTNNVTYGASYSGDTDGYDEPPGWTQDDEVRSEFDFEGFHEDASAAAGGVVSAVRFFERYSYIRDPEAIAQFGPDAVQISGAAVYNPAVITQQGDLSSSIPGTQLATAVDLAGVIFTTYGIRLSVSSGYTNQMWYSGGLWYSAPVIPATYGTAWKLPGSGIAPTNPLNPDYGFLIAADGTNPAVSHGFALYVPMIERNRKCTVGIRKADQKVAYREDRLTDCIILFVSEATNMVSIRSRYYLRGMLAPGHGDTNVYEALESDHYVLYGTPNEILSAVQTLETQLFAGTGSSFNTPRHWLDAYGISDEISDGDGDGFAAWQEYIAGTDPADRRSALVFTFAAPMPDSETILLRWQSVQGKSYTLLSSTNLMTDVWETNAAGLLGIGPECTYTGALPYDKMFFRLKSE
jgi:hypothetical protein